MYMCQFDHHLFFFLIQDVLRESQDHDIGPAISHFLNCFFGNVLPVGTKGSANNVQSKTQRKVQTSFLPSPALPSSFLSFSLLKESSSSKYLFACLCKWISMSVVCLCQLCSYAYICFSLLVGSVQYISLDENSPFPKSNFSKKIQCLDKFWWAPLKGDECNYLLQCFLEENSIVMFLLVDFLQIWCVIKKKVDQIVLVHLL